MKTTGLILAIALCASSFALGQTSGNRGTTTTPRPNSSNFGWQDRQQEATEAQEKYRAELAKMSAEQWLETALAKMSFDSTGQQVSFTDVVRIGAAVADKKAVTRETAESTAKAPSWVVEFGKKTPKILTITLTDPNSTEVQCDIGELLSAGGGHVGVFVTDFELLCLTRPADSG